MKLDVLLAFVIYDSKAGIDFIFFSFCSYCKNCSSDGGVKLFWCIAADGSVVISDDLQVI